MFAAQKFYGKLKLIFLYEEFTDKVSQKKSTKKIQFSKMKININIFFKFSNICLHLPAATLPVSPQTRWQPRFLENPRETYTNTQAESRQAAGNEQELVACVPLGAPPTLHLWFRAVSGVEFFVYIASECYFASFATFAGYFVRLGWFLVWSKTVKNVSNGTNLCNIWHDTQLVCSGKCGLHPPF